MRQSRSNLEESWKEQSISEVVLGIKKKMKKNVGSCAIIKFECSPNGEKSIVITVVCGFVKFTWTNLDY